MHDNFYQQLTYECVDQPISDTEGTGTAEEH